MVLEGVIGAVQWCIFELALEFNIGIGSSVPVLADKSILKRLVSIIAFNVRRGLFVHKFGIVAPAYRLVFH